MKMPFGTFPARKVAYWVIGLASILFSAKEGLGGVVLQSSGCGGDVATLNFAQHGSLL